MMIFYNTRLRFYIYAVTYRADAFMYNKSVVNSLRRRVQISASQLSCAPRPAQEQGSQRRVESPVIQLCHVETREDLHYATSIGRKM